MKIVRSVFWKKVKKYWFTLDFVISAISKITTKRIDNRNLNFNNKGRGGKWMKRGKLILEKGKQGQEEGYKEKKQDK